MFPGQLSFAAVDFPLHLQDVLVGEGKFLVDRKTRQIILDRIHGSQQPVLRFCCRLQFCLQPRDFFLQRSDLFDPVAFPAGFADVAGLIGRIRFPPQRKQAVAAVFRDDRSRGVGFAAIDHFNRLEDVLHIASIHAALAAVRYKVIGQSMFEELRIRQQLPVAFQLQPPFGKQCIQKARLHQRALDGIAFFIGQIGPEIDTGIERFSRNAILRQLIAIQLAGPAAFRNRILLSFPGAHICFVCFDCGPDPIHPAPDRQQFIADALFLIVGGRVDWLSDQRKPDRSRIKAFQSPQHLAIFGWRNDKMGLALPVTEIADQFFLFIRKDALPVALILPICLQFFGYVSQFFVDALLNDHRCIQVLEQGDHVAQVIPIFTVF